MISKSAIDKCVLPLKLSLVAMASVAAVGCANVQPVALTTQEVQTQPSQESAIDQIAESQKQIQALEAQIACPCAELTAELQKQVDGLQLTPPVGFGTMAFQNTGVSGSVVLAKITALGADGSLTFANGIITAYVAPT